MFWIKFFNVTCEHVDEIALKYVYANKKKTINISSAYNLVPSSNKVLSEPMFP